MPLAGTSSQKIVEIEKKPKVTAAKAEKARANMFLYLS